MFSVSLTDTKEGKQFFKTLSLHYPMQVTPLLLMLLNSFYPTLLSWVLLEYAANLTDMKKRKSPLERRHLSEMLFLYVLSLANYLLPYFQLLFSSRSLQNPLYSYNVTNPLMVTPTSLRISGNIGFSGVVR